MVFIHVFYWGTNMVIAQRALAAGSVREAQKGIYAAMVFKVLGPMISRSVDDVSVASVVTMADIEALAKEL